MRSHRGGWLGSWVLGAILVVAPAVTSTVHAQPGFGPDPFWPYNSQYAPYTSAIGPAGADAGQGASMVGRQGYVTANQFQQYLDGMAGPGRNVTDRSGVGVPYFRGSVDPAFGGRDRDYQPNAQSNQTFEDTQREVTAKYFAYFAEKDPRKRAELLREYQRAQREASRALSPRAQSPSRIVDAATRGRPEARASRASGTTRREMPESFALPHEPGTTSRGDVAARRSRPDTAAPTRGESRLLRPAPPIPSVVPSPGGGRSRANPTNILNRARGMDDRNDRTPGSRSATPRGRRTNALDSPPLPKTSE